MHIFKPLILGALIATSTATLASTPAANPGGEARLAKIIDGRTAGAPVDFIDLHNIDSTGVIDGTAIVYRDGPRLYVNRPTIGGESLDSDDILFTKTWSTELCSIDTVRLIDRASRFERGFVGLGKFVPYVKPKRS